MSTRKRTIFMMVLSMLLIIAGSVWIWLDSQEPNTSVANSENTKILKGLDIVEKCIDLLPDQKLVYRYETSLPVSFNIHYHEAGNPVYLLEDKNKKQNSGVLYPPKKQHYCLMWVNPGVEDIRLEYHSEMQFQEADPLYDRIPVHFKLHKDKQTIQLVDQSNQVLKSIQVGSVINNFELNLKSSLLAVATKKRQGSIRIYDLKRLQLLHELNLSKTPSFLTFSDDDQYLTVADEHTKMISRFSLEDGKKSEMEIPLLPLALLAGDRPNELLVRTEREVLLVKLNPLELLERNARIEFNFGEESFFADPDEVCTVHGVPHPLFTPKEVAMSPEGLSGYYFQPK